MEEITFSFFISTYNRVEDLKYTLKHLEPLLQSLKVECLICDDASTDGTSEFLNAHYPHLRLFKNEEHKGYIYSRNFLLTQVKGQYAISMDDDLNFISSNVLAIIKAYFESKPKCAVQGFRVFWGKEEPIAKHTSQIAMQVRNFVGCAHAFRMKAWKEIPEYPEWFVFYGEENYASFQFFKNNWEIHYVPEVLGHHRVDMKARKKNTKDFITRQRRALRAGWYVNFIFLPVLVALRFWFYSIWAQLKNHVLKGHLKILVILPLVFVDLFRNLPRVFNRNYRLSAEEYVRYKNLPPIPIYWTPSIKDNL